MKIFFGAAIQGAYNREERSAVHRLIIDAIKSCGYEVLSEHTTGKDYDATAKLLEIMTADPHPYLILKYSKQMLEWMPKFPASSRIGV